MVSILEGVQLALLSGAGNKNSVSLVVGGGSVHELPQHVTYNTLFSADNFFSFYRLL